jgi:poly [ADP-ribose] polymerase 2/3/4
MDIQLSRQVCCGLDANTNADLHKAIAEIINNNPTTIEEFSRIDHLCATYYSYIPHVSPRHLQIPPIRSIETVKREADFLQSLGYMLEANSIVEAASENLTENPIDAKYNGLGLVEMTPLNPASGEFTELSAYLKGSVGQSHGYKYTVEQIFRIEREGERSRFESSKFAAAKPSEQNRKLLWHGSRLVNFAGILSQGLRIAPTGVVLNGSAFGNGVYMADMSSKSAQYCCPNTTNKTALMLLCEAELGREYETTWGRSGIEEQVEKAGCWSTKGVGQMFPASWKDAEFVHDSLKGVKMVSLHPLFITTYQWTCMLIDYAAGHVRRNRASSKQRYPLQRIHCLRHCSGSSPLCLSPENQWLNQSVY